MHDTARRKVAAEPPVRPRRSKGGRGLRLLRASLFLLWLAGTLGLGWLMLVFPVRLPKAPNRDVPIEIAHGTDVEGLAVRLVQEKMITQPHAFVLYMRLLGADQHLRTGAVVINRALPLRDLLPRLALGFGIARIRVPIPEGFTRFDVATRLSRFGICKAEEFEQAGRDPALLRELEIPGESVEGYLFPATYVVLQDSPPASVLREMVRVFHDRTRERLARYERERDGAPASLTLHEIVTLASIVEREARQPDERPTIAGVFMNRLTSPDFRPKRLQADPTVAYGCLVARERVPSCADFDGRRVTPAMVRDPENPYSTYRHEGLPPGPICNPGLSALEAVLHPEPHQFFYFVTRGAGRHAFSRSLDEHNARIRGEPSVSAAATAAE
jgi:UPF0755 protein